MAITYELFVEARTMENPYKDGEKMFQYLIEVVDSERPKNRLKVSGMTSKNRSNGREVVKALRETAEQLEKQIDNYEMFINSGRSNGTRDQS